MGSNVARKIMFRGEERTVHEIAALLNLPVQTVYSRLHYGRELDAPKQLARKPRDEEPPCEDKKLRYEQDLECRVAHAVCGPECTQQELALLFNTTHQRISQIEECAMQKIRNLAKHNRDAKALLDALEALDELRGQRESRAVGIRVRGGVLATLRLNYISLRCA